MCPLLEQRSLTRKLREERVKLLVVRLLKVFDRLEPMRHKYLGKARAPPFANAVQE